MFAVDPASPAQFAEWKSYLEGLETPTAFLDPAWLGVLEGAYPCKPLLFIARDDQGRIKGGALVYHHAVHHRTLYSTPFGMQAREADVADALLAALAEHARDNAIAACDLAPGLGMLDCKAVRHWTRPSFTLDTGADPEAFWSALPSKARNTIRKAQTQDLAMEIDPERLDAWYEIYADQCLAKRLAIHNKRYFELLFERFAEDAVLITGSHAGAVISGMVFLIAKPFAHYLFNASRPEAMPTGVNTLLMKEFADVARARGVRSIDLGESRTGSGVYVFKKKQLGGEEVAMHHYDLLPQAGPGEPSLEERLLHAARFIWPLLPSPAKRYNLRELKALHRLI